MSNRCPIQAWLVAAASFVPQGTSERLDGGGDGLVARGSEGSVGTDVGKVAHHLLAGSISVEQAKVSVE